MTRLYASVALSALLFYPHFAQAENVDWDGFYGGVQANYAFGNSQHNGDSFYALEYDLDGVIGGAHAGYRWSYGGFVFGPEVGFDVGTVSDTATPLAPRSGGVGGSFTDVRRTEASNFMHAGARIGYQFDRFLPSFYAGIVNAELESQKQTLNFGTPFSALFVENERVWGFALGASLDVAINSSWSGGLTYTYVDLGSELNQQRNFSSDTEFSVHMIGARLTYRFPPM